MSKPSKAAVDAAEKWFATIFTQEMRSTQEWSQLLAAHFDEHLAPERADYDRQLEALGSINTELRELVREMLSAANPKGEPWRCPVFARAAALLDNDGIRRGELARAENE